MWVSHCLLLPTVSKAKRSGNTQIRKMRVWVFSFKVGPSLHLFTEAVLRLSWGRLGFLSKLSHVNIDNIQIILLLFVINRAIMVSHKEFVDAGKKPGLQVWRIENLDLKPVPKALYGNFYTGDAYLLLFSTSAPSYNIHMWLGKTSVCVKEKREGPPNLTLLC